MVGEGIQGMAWSVEECSGMRGRWQGVWAPSSVGGWRAFLSVGTSLRDRMGWKEY
jgi:hypothetical protein